MIKPDALPHIGPGTQVTGEGLRHYDESSECAHVSIIEVACDRTERTLMGCADPPPRRGTAHPISVLEFKTKEKKKWLGWGVTGQAVALPYTYDIGAVAADDLRVVLVVEGLLVVTEDSWLAIDRRVCVVAVVTSP